MPKQEIITLIAPRKSDEELATELKQVNAELAPLQARKDRILKAMAASVVEEMQRRGWAE